MLVAQVQLGPSAVAQEWGSKQQVGALPHPEHRPGTAQALALLVSGMLGHSAEEEAKALREEVSPEMPLSWLETSWSGDLALGPRAQLGELEP